MFLPLLGDAPADFAAKVDDVPLMESVFRCTWA
jgi:hypothetical protein